MSETPETFFRYIPVRPSDIHWGLYVTGAGWTHIRPGESYPPPGHPKMYRFSWTKGRTLPEYTFSYFVRGEGQFESHATGMQIIQPGDCFLLFPNVWHRYRPTPHIGWDSYWVSFNGKIMDSLVAKKFFAPDRAVLRLGPSEPILATFERLLRRVQKAPMGFSHLIAADTLEILAFFAAVPASGDHMVLDGPLDIAAVQDPVVAEALRLIWGHSGESINVNELVRELPLARRTLERRFHRETGRTLLEEIYRCRMDRATRLLGHTDMPVKDIAGAAGFPSIEAMLDAFHNSYGASPSEYRDNRRRRHARRPTKP